jgi:hypothetical protein
MTMSKRPKIRGRGADVYLGGDFQDRPVLPQTKSERSQASETVDNEKGFASFTKPGESLCGFDGVKRAAVSCIENGEKLANQAIEQQEKSIRWAKATPLAPLLEAQIAFARKFVESSASAVRNLWQIDPRTVY